jgi:DNA invertase Pin-like site-specific DNA recombinase
LVSVADGIDTTTLGEGFTRTVLSAMAGFESDLILMRLNEQAGRRSASPP